MTVQNGGRQVLIQGLVLILTGLLWGFALPLTPYPRLAVGAHMQFETNGLLFVVIGILLLKVPHGIGGGAVWVLVVSPWLTWLMTLSEVANAWWGTNQTLPIAAAQAGAKGGGAVAGARRERVSRCCRAGFGSVAVSADRRIREAPRARGVAETRRDSFSTSAVSSTLNPPKKRNSITLALRGSISASGFNASSMATISRSCCERGQVGNIVQIHSWRSAASLGRAAGARRIHQNSPHNPGADGEENARGPASLTPAASTRWR
jgi:hypothetical protein